MPYALLGDFCNFCLTYASIACIIQVSQKEVNPMQSVEPTKLYSIPQAADVLGVSHRWVLTAIESGHLSGIKVTDNAQLRISGSELIRLTQPRTAFAN